LERQEQLKRQYTGNNTSNYQGGDKGKDKNKGDEIKTDIIKLG
jgi:hypothetical protein